MALVRRITVVCSIAGCALLLGCPDRTPQAPKVEAHSELRILIAWNAPAALHSVDDSQWHHQ